MNSTKELIQSMKDGGLIKKLIFSAISIGLGASAIILLISRRRKFRQTSQ